MRTLFTIIGLLVGGAIAAIGAHMYLNLPFSVEALSAAPVATLLEIGTASAITAGGIGIVGLSIKYA